MAGCSASWDSPIGKDELMFDVRESSNLQGFGTSIESGRRVVVLALLGLVGLLMLLGLLTFETAFGYIAAALGFAVAAVILVWFVSKALEIALLALGAFIPVLAIAALLDQTNPSFVPPTLVALAFVAAGIVAGYRRPDRIRLGLLVTWAVIVIVPLLSIGSFTDSPEYFLENLAFLVVGTGGPVILVLLGGLLGRYIARREQRDTVLEFSGQDRVAVSRVILPGLAVLLLAFTPIYALDQTAFRDPLFDVTLLDDGRIELSHTTVRDGPFGIQYRIINAASEPRRLSFRGAQFDTGLGGGGPNEPSRMLQPGESISAVMAISGGTGPGQIELCNSPDGDCVVLTIVE
jgi:hypothetical protein